MTSRAEPTDDSDKITLELYKIAGVIVLGAIMSVLDTTVVNVAIPTFQLELSDTDEPLAYSAVAWAVTAYTLAIAAVVPLTGWAADRFGTRRLFLGAIGLFTCGSLLCAFAWDIESLIGFRVLQGLGGGMLMPLGIMIMTRVGGPRRIGRLMAMLGVPMLLGPILGPTVGGLLIDAASWHWIFLINLPLGLVGLIYARTVLPRDIPESRERLDVVGVLLLSPGVAAFLYGVSMIPEEGTIRAAEVVVPTIIGTLLIGGFVFWSFRTLHPLLDLRLFRDRNLTVSIVTIFLLQSVFVGVLLLVPTYFQQVDGYSVRTAGLLVAANGVGQMLTMPLAGRLSDRLPAGRIVPFGFLGILIGVLGLALNTDPGTSEWTIMAFLFIAGLGMGAAVMPVFSSALRSLEAPDIARGSTLVNVTPLVGAASAVAVISVVLTNATKQGEVVPGSDEIPGADNGLTAAELAAGSHTEHGSGLIDTLQVPASVLAQGFQDLADAFQSAYWVTFAIVALTLIPVALLPRKLENRRLQDQGDNGISGGPPAILH